MSLRIRDRAAPVRHRIPIPFVLFALLAPACRGSSGPDGPEPALEEFVAAARHGDRQAASARLTSGTLALIARFESLAKTLQATNAPRDVLQATLAGFASERPRVLETQVEGESAACVVRYRQGHRARLRFRLEGGLWRLDLEDAIRPSIETLERARQLREGVESGKIAPPRPDGDD